MHQDNKTNTQDNPTAAGESARKDGGTAMPQVTFATFILSLASSAMVQLGEVPNPENGQMQQDLDMARHTIDVLDMLRSKTLASLDSEEQRLLDGLLYELRMKYVIQTR